MPFTRRMDIVEEVQWNMRIRPHIEVIPLTSSEFDEKVKSSAILTNASRYWKKILYSDILYWMPSNFLIINV